jgi:hypothetical protein
MLTTDSLSELYDGAGRRDMMADWEGCVTEARTGTKTKVVRDGERDGKGGEFVVPCAR